jgi:regulatory protein
VVKVRKLTPSKKRYTVVFLLEDDSEATFLVSEDLVVEYRLIPGKILDDFAFQAFQKAVHIDEVFQKALAYGIKYPQTVSGMASYLRERSVSIATVEEILAKLMEMRILDDEFYVKSYVERHVRIRHEGKTKITYDLKQKGVSFELITKYLDDIASCDLSAGMDALLDRKLSAFRDKPFRKAVMLMTHHLVEKGYDREQAEAFIESRRFLFHQDAEDETLIKKEYETVLRHLQKQHLTTKDLKEKIIRSLMNKGFPYALIKKQLERGPLDESEDVGI